MPAARTHPRRPRRTQAERRLATRTGLLDATIDCLTRDGYAGMSTNDVVRRAGVSRGALVHHYPTKAQLAVAALDRVARRPSRRLRGRVRRCSRPSQRTADVAIDVLWTLFQGETFAAWLELTVAARTDPDLRTRLAEVNRRFDDGVLATFNRTFPPPPTPPSIPASPCTSPSPS